MKNFNKRFNQTQDLETTFELALKNNWSMERAFAELRVTMYITLDLQSSDKTLALQELQEIKDKELDIQDTKITLEMSDTWYIIDTLEKEYPEIYKTLADDIPKNIQGNNFYKEMLIQLKREYNEIWKEL